MLDIFFQESNNNRNNRRRTEKQSKNQATMPPKKRTRTSTKITEIESDTSPTVEPNIEEDKNDNKVVIRNKKKVVKIAKDVDKVLGPCRSLKDDMRRSKLQDPFSSENVMASSLLPADQAIVEVAEMDASQVLDGMEQVAVRIATQVLAKQGFTLNIPSRAASNQIYVPELDRIVLGGKRGTRSFLNVKVR